MVLIYYNITTSRLKLKHLRYKFHCIGLNDNFVPCLNLLYDAPVKCVLAVFNYNIRYDFNIRRIQYIYLYKARKGHWLTVWPNHWLQFFRYFLTSDPNNLSSYLNKRSRFQTFKILFECELSPIFLKMAVVKDGVRFSQVLFWPLVFVCSIPCEPISDFDVDGQTS